MKLFFAAIIVLVSLLSQFVEAEDTIKVLMLGTPHDPVPSDQVRHVKDISGKIFIKNRFYEGSIRILKDENGLHVINTIPFNKYIEVTVAAEIEKEWELEALKAQAVITRTYAMFYKKSNAGKNYHVSSSVLHKIYDNNINPLVSYAVKITMDEVLTYDNFPIKALYHDTCKGKTELPEEVWKESYPYLKSVSCNNKNAPYENWQRKYTLNEISKALGLSEVKNIEIAAYTATGRVKTLRLFPGKGADSAMEVNTLELMKLLGPEELPSTSFSILKKEGNIYFTGNGSGHGVGLSKWGALEMARQGKNYREILTHFYPGTTIQRSDELDRHEFVSSE